MLHFARRQNSWFPLFKKRWEFRPTKTHTTHKWHSLRKHLGESNVIKTHRKVLKWIKLYLQNTLYTPSQKLDRELLKQKIRAFERIRQAQKVLFSYMPVEFDGQNVPLFLRPVFLYFDHRYSFSYLLAYQNCMLLLSFQLQNFKANEMTNSGSSVAKYVLIWQFQAQCLIDIWIKETHSSGF